MRKRADRAARKMGWLLGSGLLLGCTTGEELVPVSRAKVATYYFNGLGSVEASADRLSRVDLVFYAFWGIEPSGHLVMMRPDLDLEGAASTPTPAPLSLAEAITRFPASRGYLKQACALREDNPGVAFRPSIGGWGNGAGFSAAFASTGGRDAFTADAQALTQSFVCGDGKPLFDGVDIDWEYPQIVVGGSSTTLSPEDGTNLHLAVIAARQALGEGPALSLTVPHGDSGITLAEADSNAVAGDGGSIRSFFNGANGQLAPDNAAFIQAVSAFTIMAYDFMAFALRTTPNAPMRLDAGLNLPDTVGGLDALANYGVPPEKILLGAPLYGRSVGAMVAAGEACLQSEPTAANHGTGVALPDFTAKNPNGSQGPCSISWIDYHDLAVERLNDGAFDSGLAGSDQVLAYWYGPDLTNNRAAEILRPGSTSLAYLSQYRDVFLSFDSPASIAAKARAIEERGLAGIAFWEVSQDRPYDAGRVDIDGVSYPLSLVRAAVEALE